jgi:uncharacterized protein YdeI (YjbR/CyaY-like superfamily)
METTGSLAEGFFRKTGRWQAEYAELRRIILACGLAEGLKWGVPCYTFQEKNVVLIHGFKDYCALLFIKGALLKDPQGRLVQQTENVQAGRQIRFTGVSEIVKMESLLKAFVQEAVEVEKTGMEVVLKDNAQQIYPEEFERKLRENAALKTAFDALTPGRKRAYNLFFSAPKQAKTREARIEKSLPKILDGKGLDDF